jgi:Glycoside Hydrolase Family 113
MLRLPVLLAISSGLLLAACSSWPTPTQVPAAPFPPGVPLGIGRARDPATRAPVPDSTLSEVTTATPQPLEGMARAVEGVATPQAPAFPTPMRPAPLPTVSVTSQPTLAASPQAPSRDPAFLNEFQRGIAYNAIHKGDYGSADSDRSLDLLFARGANYISLLVTWYQHDWHSTDIEPGANTPSDEDLAHVIQYAHAHAVHVLLKPQIDFSNDPDHWRGQINLADISGWQDWFDSYRRFIMYYAGFAQRNGVEEFAVGTELVSASEYTGQWRAIIREVRAEYSGLLTYSANHSGEEISVDFWNDLDFIGVSSFYHLTNFDDPSVAQLVEGWKWPILELQRVHNRFPNQPVIFTEVGYPSLNRSNIWPWNWNRQDKIDLDEQAKCYEALFRVWWKNPNRSWFRGMFIWNWLASPNQGGPQNGDYTPHGKPAELVLRAWFADSPQDSPLNSTNFSTNQ